MKSVESDMPIDVVTFGEAMMLLVADQPGPLEAAQAFSKRTAGAETNVAIGLARLGLNVAWCSRLGTDSMGRYLLQSIKAEGIDCSHVVSDAAQRTGFMIKGRVQGGGDPEVEYHRKGSAASLFQPVDIDIPWLVGARHLHATGIFAALSENCLAVSVASMEAMRQQGKTVSFDPNLRPSLWASESLMRQTINSLAFRADWVLPGIEEGKLLTGRDSPEEISRFYLDAGVPLVVIKLGADGAYWASAQEAAYVPGFAVEKVIDTVGAGDGFAAGVISGMLEGLGVNEAVRRGAWIGARAVQVLGDTEGLPTRAQLDAFFHQP
jgi:sugar/nucleoside kinase (ribokinase family)